MGNVCGIFRSCCGCIWRASGNSGPQRRVGLSGIVEHRGGTVLDSRRFSFGRYFNNTYWRHHAGLRTLCPGHVSVSFERRRRIHRCSADNILDIGRRGCCKCCSGERNTDWNCATPCCRLLVVMVGHSILATAAAIVKEGVKSIVRFLQCWRPVVDRSCRWDSGWAMTAMGWSPVVDQKSRRTTAFDFLTGKLRKLSSLSNIVAFETRRMTAN